MHHVCLSESGLPCSIYYFLFLSIYLPVSRFHFSLPLNRVPSAFACVLYPLSAEGHLGSSHFLAIGNRVAMNMAEQAPVEVTTLGVIMLPWVLWTSKANIGTSMWNLLLSCRVEWWAGKSKRCSKQYRPLPLLLVATPPRRLPNWRYNHTLQEKDSQESSWIWPQSHLADLLVAPKGAM